MIKFQLYPECIVHSNLLFLCLSIVSMPLLTRQTPNWQIRTTVNQVNQHMSYNYCTLYNVVILQGREFTYSFIMLIWFAYMNMHYMNDVEKYKRRYLFSVHKGLWSVFRRCCSLIHDKSTNKHIFCLLILLWFTFFYARYVLLVRIHSA